MEASKGARCELADEGPIRHSARNEHGRGGVVRTQEPETGSSDLVASALGDQHRRELRAAGAAISMDEAVSYALANVDPKFLTGPVLLA